MTRIRFGRRPPSSKRQEAMARRLRMMMTFKEEHNSRRAALMQAQSDIIFGRTRATGAEGVDGDFYVRQLRDWKFSLPIEQMIPKGMTVYARPYGWTLARGQARSGDHVALAAYVGGSAQFDQAIAEFVETYANQKERDYAVLQTAVKDGKADASTQI